MEFGETWWGRRWRRALESLGATYPNPRLPRGRSLARTGAVEDLVVAPGEVSARVRQRDRVHEVRLRVPAFTDAEWRTATSALAGKIRHAVALLDGTLPEDVDDTLREVELSLFPRKGELSSECGCTTKADPCAHAAAVHYVLATALDDDPFLLTKFRGREREPLLSGLRAARLGEPGDWFSARGDLAAITVHPVEPDGEVEALRLLGPAPGFRPGEWESVARRAAARAWALADAPQGG
ncbi:hypothetical protein [Saccharopolyspora taberi]|uniref:SWIM-type domain-containing protein n=1 Tax=Saccharopolyspora taberi TaxID=60895 RepID=A0ABN3VHI7_9PSEU